MKKTSYVFPAEGLQTPMKDLPDPFLKADGTRVKTIDEWKDHREYLYDMAEFYLYGESPAAPEYKEAKILEEKTLFGGKAIWQKTEIFFAEPHAFSFVAEVYRPAAEGKYPVIVANAFTQFPACPIPEEVVDAGYVLATYEREQFAPDHAERFQEGICGKLYPNYSWRGFAMWAWGQSRLLDYVLTLEYVNPECTVATGFSRGAKTAIWAAASDERFTLCVPACGGCGGAGVFRFSGSRFGPDTGKYETLGHMLRPDRYWYWFNDTAASFSNVNGDCLYGNEASLPMDMHFIRALIAPRPMLCTEGLDDSCCDPFGTQASWRAGEEVYAFLGASGKNAIHYREGMHAHNGIDWRVLLDFCDVMFRGKEKKSLFRLVEKEDPAVRFNWKAPEKE